MGKSTVARRIHADTDLFWGPVKTDMFLPPRCYPLRLAFCRLHCRESWRNVIFVDSKLFTMRHVDTRRRPRMWQHATQSPPLTQPKTRASACLHVYGAITWEGKLSLVKVTGTTGMRKRFVKLAKGPDGKPVYHDGVCAKEFRGVLDHWAPEMKAKRSSPVVMADNAPPHTQFAKYLQTTHSIQGLKGWPAHSPDLNPIENIWGWMEKQLERRQYANLAEYEKCVKSIWDSLPLELIRKLYTTMRKRLTECIKAGGQRIKY